MASSSTNQTSQAAPQAATSQFYDRVHDIVRSSRAFSEALNRENQNTEEAILRLIRHMVSNYDGPQPVASSSTRSHSNPLQPVSIPAPALMAPPAVTPPVAAPPPVVAPPPVAVQVALLPVPAQPPLHWQAFPAQPHGGAQNIRSRRPLKRSYAFYVPRARSPTPIPQDADEPEEDPSEIVNPQEPAQPQGPSGRIYSNLIRPSSAAGDGGQTPGVTDTSSRSKGKGKKRAREEDHEDEAKIEEHPARKTRRGKRSDPTPTPMVAGPRLAVIANPANIVAPPLRRSSRLAPQSLNNDPESPPRASGARRRKGINSKKRESEAFKPIHEGVSR